MVVKLWTVVQRTFVRSPVLPAAFYIDDLYTTNCQCTISHHFVHFKNIVSLVNKLYLYQSKLSSPLEICESDVCSFCTGLYMSFTVFVNMSQNVQSVNDIPSFLLY